MSAKRWIGLFLALVGCLGFTGILPTGAYAAAGTPKPQMVLVAEGVSLVPIVIFKDAPPLTRRAADELAEYIEKTSGARPEVLEGLPDPVPEQAIWVGYQPKLDELFPEIDFDFQHPEEILIACDGKNLVIAGRDCWNPEHMQVGGLDGVQQEYGTHNAVYTFLQDYLGVRWLWPGMIGEDILPQKTIAFGPFEYRYHPQVRVRGGLMAYSTLFRSGPEPREATTGGISSGYWMRAQRLQLDSLGPIGGGHGFGSWWKRFHETHPEYFALQPDGTRSLCTDPGNAKMCMSNPDVWEQWLVDVAEKLEANPNERVFNASAGDSYHRGHCICENCRAWDHPDGELRRLSWDGMGHNYVALSEREITLANILGRKLKERYPGRELYVYTMAYGPARPAPIEVVPEDNVIIGDVANFLFRSDMLDRDSQIGKTHREQFAEWGKLTKLHYWRPNVGAPVGGQWGMPDVPLRRTMADLKFAAENGWMGLYIDYVREYWSTQGPLYYLMAQLTWNPQADGEAILKDYYQRAFGPAAREMEDYWNYMERIREECYGTEQPGRADQDILEFYNEERLTNAYDLLHKAKAALGADDELYRERIAFVEAGLDFTRLATECGRMARLVKGKKDPDGKALAKIHASWEELRALQQRQPGSMRWRMFWSGYRGDGNPTTPRYAPTLWVESDPAAVEGSSD
ncbi:MAG: DUF4838 domain-containing protein [Kiritimatiellia bacterium]